MNKILIILQLLIIHSVCMCEETSLWVGAHVWTNSTSERPGYWMGQMSSAQFDDIINGKVKDGYFKLSSTCWFEIDDKNAITAVKDNADDYENGVVYFRVNKLDRVILLNGDPRKIFKEKQAMNVTP